MHLYNSSVKIKWKIYKRYFSNCTLQSYMKSIHLMRSLSINGNDKTNATSLSFESRIVKTLLRRQGPRLGGHRN